MARNITLLCYWSCLLVCLDTFLVVLTSSVELCFRLISPVDCLCLYRLVDHKSCDLWVPRCGLCGPHFPKNVDFLVHIFLIWVTNLKMAAMLLGSPHFFYGESPNSPHFYVDYFGGCTVLVH